MIRFVENWSKSDYNIKQGAYLDKLFKDFGINYDKMADKIIDFMGKDWADLVSKLNRIPSYNEFKNYLLKLRGESKLIESLKRFSK